MSELKFKNGKFKIMVVGDVHEKYPPDYKSEDTLRLINAMLDRYTPDLAVVMGDLVSDYGCFGGENRNLTPEEMREAYSFIFEPYITRGIPFAFVFGNHDDEKIYSKQELFGMIKSLGGCVIEDTPNLSGCGNCNVPVKSTDGKTTPLNLWFFDSHNRDALGGYDWVHPDQIRWYENKCDELAKENGGEVIPAIHFQHIPVCEEYELLKKVSRLNPYKVQGCGVRDEYYYAVADKNNTVGYLGEGPCTPDINCGQFASWKAKGDVFAAFFGHDHMNDFVGTYDGIMLGQCKCSGFHMFGDGLRQGVRMITVREDDVRNIKTEMCYYRDIFGTKCNSIKGLDLLTDRVRQNSIVASNIIGGAAIAVGIGLLTAAAVKSIKKKSSKK